MSALLFCLVAASDPDEGLRSGDGAGDQRGQQEILYVLPIIAGEYIGLVSAGLRSDLAGIETDGVGGYGFAFGGHLGFMLGPFRVGALYQRTHLLAARGLAFNKLYLEFGLGGRRGAVGVSVMLACGWAFFNAPGVSMRNGGGARATLGVDFYIIRYFSIGPEVSVDGSGYVADASVYGAWGLTAGLRIGVHL